MWYILNNKKKNKVIKIVEHCTTDIRPGAEHWCPVAGGTKHTDVL